MKKLLKKAGIYCLCAVIALPALNISLKKADASEEYITVTERNLLAYSASEQTIDATVTQYFNQSSTLGTWQSSIGGFYFMSKPSAAVANGLITLEEERYRIFPDKSYNSAENERVYYSSAVNNFEEKYLKFRFAVYNSTNFSSVVTINPKIGLSATSAGSTNPVPTDVLYLNIGDYIDIANSVKNAKIFYEAVIPISDFLEKGEFKALNGSASARESFDAGKINGFAVACGMSTELTEEKALFNLDNVEIVSRRKASHSNPIELIFANGRLLWKTTAYANPDSYNVYKDGALIASTAETELEVNAAGRYTVCAVYNGEESTGTAIFVDSIPDMRALNSAAYGEDYAMIFGDGYENGNYLVQKGAWGDASADKSCIGDKSYKITMVGATAEERIYGGITNILIRSLDYDNAALQFMYNPVLKRENTWVGLLCQSVTDNTSSVDRGKVSMMRISLKDYINLTENDYSEDNWIKVTIPIKHFLENGEFDAFRGSDTSFIPYTTSGVVFEYSAEDIPAKNTAIAYIDEIKIIENVAPPKELAAYTDISGAVTLNWLCGSGKACKYEILRGNDSLGVVSGRCSYTDKTAVTGTSYIYSVRAVGDNCLSPAQSICVVSGTGGADNYDKSEEELVTADAVTVVSESGAVLSWSGSSDKYVVYKNGTLYGLTEICCFTDSEYTAGDEYSVSAIDSEQGIIYSPCAAPVDLSKPGGRISASAVFTDRNGNICNNEEVYPEHLKADISNYSGGAEQAVLYMAHYQDGILISITGRQITVPQGESSFEDDMDFYYGFPGKYEVKAFLFRGDNSLLPLTGQLSARYINEEKESSGKITVLPEEYQTITGWGVSPFSMAKQDFLSFQEKEDWPQMYDKVYGELGITSIRVPFSADCGDSEGNISETQLEYRVKYIQRARDYNINDYIITYWSPPSVWVERVEGEVTWTQYQYHLISGCEEQYCDYIVDCIRYLSNRGVGLPSGVSFQNEPQDGKSYPTYTLEQYKMMTKLLRQKLDAAGMESVLIMAPETASYYSMYRFTGGTAPGSGSEARFNFDNLTEDSDYADSIGALCVHSYYQTSIGSKDDDTAKFASEADKFPGKERWQTEFSGLPRTEEAYGAERAGGTDMLWENDMGAALFTMRILAADVGTAGMNRWYYWQAYRSHYNLDLSNESYDILNNKAGQQTVVFGQPGKEVHTGKLYDCFRLLFGSVPAGSVVKKCESTDSTVVNGNALRSDLLAFETEKGTVVMLINISDDAKTLDFSGLTGSRAEISYVSRYSSDIRRVTKTISEGNIEKVHIPPKSVMLAVCAYN